MCLAKLAVASGAVVSEPRQLSALDEEERLVALRARHFEPGVGFSECGFNLLLGLDPLNLAESADSGEQSRELPQSGAASAANSDCFFCERQSPYTITESEVCSCYRCE